MRRILATAAIAGGVAFAGCGTETVRSVTGSAPTATAPKLVYFKRTVGFDPLSSELTVYADGRAVAIITLGGVDGEKKHVFRLTDEQLRRVSDLLAHAPLRNTSCCNINLYIYWLVDHAHSVRLQQGRIPRSLRPLVGELNSIADAHMSY